MFKKIICGFELSVIMIIRSFETRSVHSDNNASIRCFTELFDYLHLVVVRYHFLSNDYSVLSKLWMRKSCVPFG